jgi:phage repressor protein C with HTH and peptisase S24 domain
MNQQFDKGEGFVVRQRSAAQTQIRKPSFLDYSDEAYAATNYGDSMQPRYYTGDTLFIDPTLDAMPQDDVVVMFRLPDRMAGIFRELVSQTDDQIVIKDVASNKPVTLNKADIYALHVVVGSQRNRGGG